MTTYKKLELIVLPQLKNFQDDLKVFDKNTLSSYKGRFLYGIRENGTNLIKLDEKILVKYNPTKEKLSKQLENNLHTLKYANKKFYYFNGDSIVEVNWEQLHTYFSIFVKSAYRLLENIEKLNIDELACSLVLMMKETKNWKAILKDSEYASYRRIRNNFNFFKFKKVSSIDDARNMLLEHCHALN